MLIYSPYIYWMCIYIYMHSCLYTKLQKLPAVFFFSMYIGHRFMCVYKYTNTHVENIAKPYNKLRKSNLAYSSLL